MRSYLESYDFPSQRVSDKEKEKYEWYSSCCDFIIAQAEAYKDVAETERKYNVLQGNIPEEFYRKTINPYNAKNEKYTRFPATLRNYDLMKGVIRRYVGEYISNPHDFVVAANNPEVVLAKNNKLKQELNKIVQKQIAAKIQQLYGQYIQQGGNPEEFKVDYAYTVDGGDVEDIEFENFNASSATVQIQGLSIHPGSAKNRMINSLLVGFEFNSLLPVFDNPAYTEGYEGFNHLVSMEGDCEKSTMHYIIRNHDLNLLRKQEADFRNAMEFLNKKYGENTITIDFEDSYANMRSYIEKRMDIIDNVKAKMAKLGVTAKSSAIRGGTDGARLTYMGIMCPNLGTGGRNYHGKYEYASINEMKFMAKLLVEIVKVN